MSKINGTLPYVYDSMPIPGGGYVCGFAFHQKEPGILYARTDIGGVYRYDFENDTWISLMDHVTMLDLSETFPLAIALDDNRPGRLYIACGTGRHRSSAPGWLLRSDDYGKTFARFALPFSVHGNNPGRGTGTRLVVDPNNPSTLYFASQSAGLVRSLDYGETWDMIPVCTADHPRAERNLAFVFLAPDSKTLVVSASGLANHYRDEDPVRDWEFRGHSLYVSYDAGETFTELAQAEAEPGDYCKFIGHVGHRYAFDGTNLYITMNQTGQYSWLGYDGYSADAGDMTDGRVLRYTLQDGHFTDPVDITPVYPDYGLPAEGIRYAAFGGIAVTPEKPGYLLLSTICRHAGDLIFQSKDYGKTWEIKLFGLEIGNLHFQTPYMKPQYNGDSSIIHWISDIHYNPFNPDMAVFGTGTGIFMSTDLQQEPWSFTDHCKGLEETVHLNVYAPTGGRTVCLDIVGDLGGFAFTEVGVPCENSFADEKGNRYITSINADYSDLNPETVVITPRGNWTWQTKGGIIVSTDGGQTVKRPDLPYGITPRLDALFSRIEHPNNNAGWVALSADAKTYVWSVADQLTMRTDTVLYSHDLGQTYGHCKIYDLSGNLSTDDLFKPFSDRVDANTFYGFGEDSRFYVSHDGGETFCEKACPEGLPHTLLAGIDAMNIVGICAVSGESGQFYFAMNTNGLYKVTYHFDADTFTCSRITEEGESAYAFGLGILPGETDYIHGKKAFYLAGTLAGKYGFYRSYDQGASWTRINDDEHQFGEIKGIDGDKRTAGRFFIATGSRGLLYGTDKNPDVK